MYLGNKVLLLIHVLLLLLLLSFNVFGSDVS